MEEEGSIGEFILKGLINGALSKGGGDGYTKIVSMLFGSDSSTALTEMQSQLAQIEADLTAIRADLKNLSEQIEALALQESWSNALQNIDDLQFKVDAMFNDLSAAVPGQSDAPAEVVTWVTNNGSEPQLMVHDLLTPYKLTGQPWFPGVLSVFASVALLNTQQNPDYRPDDVGPGSLLDLDYQRMEKYFRGYIWLQIQITMLMVNVFTHQGYSASVNTALTTLQSDLVAQCDAFLWSVESYVVGYCGDDTLLSLFRQTGSSADPLRRADTFVNSYLYAKDQNATLPGAATLDVFRVRVWGATSTDGSLSTSTFVPLSDGSGSGVEDGSASPFTLQGSTTLKPDWSWHVVFDAVANKQWSLFRHTFLSPPPGVWSIAPLSNDIGSYNLVIDPYSYDVRYNRDPECCVANGLQYTIDDDIRAADHPVTLTARTMLSLLGTACATVYQTYDFRNSMTLETWVRSPSPGAFVSTVGRNSSGNAAGVFSLGITVSGQLYGMVSVLWTVVDSYGQGETETQANLTTAVNAAITDTNWHHVAAAFDADSGGIALYLDGAAVFAAVTGNSCGGMGSDLYFDQTQLFVGIPTVDATFIAGSGFNFQGAFANGSYSEVRVWSTCLSAGAIQQQYRQRLSTGANLAGLWNLDFGSLADRSTGEADMVLLADTGSIVPMQQPDWLSLPSNVGPWIGGHAEPSDVYVARLGNALYLAYRDGTNALAVQSSTDGTNWAPVAVAASFSFHGSPALTQTLDSDNNPILVIAYRTSDGTNTFGCATSYDGQHWTPVTWPSITFRGTPGALSNSNLMLFRAIDGSNVLWFTDTNGNAGRVDGITFRGNPTGYSPDGGAPFVAFRANDPSQSLYVAAGNEFLQFTQGWPVVAPDQTPVTLHGSPSMAADANGVLWIAFRWQDTIRIASITQAAASVQGLPLTATGVADVTYVIDGPPTHGAAHAVAARTWSNPTLMVDGATMYLAYRDRDDAQTYWITTSADGAVWTPPLRIGTKWQDTLPPGPRKVRVVAPGSRSGATASGAGPASPSAPT